MTVQSRTLVALATYNERENLAPLVAEIRRVAPDVDILVVDDNSPDGTGKLADELARQDPRLLVLHRSGKLGLGTAILAGMRFAMEKNYDVFTTMDADFSHHPRYLPNLREGMQSHDLMIGSRYVPGGGVANWPWYRYLISKTVNFVTWPLLRLPARDCSGGFRCYSVSLLRRTNMENLLSQGYSFQQEILYRCKRAGARIGEAPILFENRRAGQTKVGLGEAFRSITMLFRLGFRALAGDFFRFFRPKEKAA